MCYVYGYRAWCKWKLTLQTIPFYSLFTLITKSLIPTVYNLDFKERLQHIMETDKSESHTLVQCLWIYHETCACFTVRDEDKELNKVNIRRLRHQCKVFSLGSNV